MIKRLQLFWDKLNSSFWFIPLLIFFGAIATGVALILLDYRLHFEPKGDLKLFFSFSADSARSILSTISGAMIGVAGTVFSITLVALTLASSSFGSRLLKNFMYDKLNQVVLGTYVATFIYCLLILNAISDTDQFKFIPVISVLVAILLALFNIILLIIFIHHIAISIQSDKVISEITEQLIPAVKNLIADNETKPVHNIAEERNKYAFCSELISKENGYLESIDYEEIANIAEKQNALIELHIRPGKYVLKDSIFGEFWGHEALTQETQDDINEQLILGKIRTSIQDIEFGVHQLVEIALRALSPGINDPYTAIACIDNLSSVLALLTAKDLPAPYIFDEKEQLRVHYYGHSFEGILNAAFNQIRQCAVANPAVLIRVLEAIIAIYKVAHDEDHKAALLRHAKMLRNAAEKNFAETQDYQDFNVRYLQIDKS